VRLRSIVLAGFKTFARHTDIAFDPGVTAVVGPNGCGKSNIVDAFKWVLGETQARDLRGRKMEEIIYAGGQRRPRAAAAEVSIVIDNSDHQLLVDYEEVAIRRRMDRSGQSDYFLNGSRVRRRDLMDLLAATGLTTDSYAIVTQADIESIISATPEQRRELVEAAAQVRGVKAKRTEAAAQLQELAGNLLRLEDLRSEVEPRLETVRAQAVAAREAAEARRRLELLRGSIAWEEWREARDTHRRALSQVSSLENKLAEARRAAEAAEEEFQRRRRELQAAQDRRLERQRTLSAKRLELSQAENRLALAEERVRGQSALAKAARAEEVELGARLEAARERRRQLGEEIDRAEAELAGVPGDPAPPPAEDAQRARQARQTADKARREEASARSALASVRSRRQFLEESESRLEPQVRAAEQALGAAEEEAAAATEVAGRAADAASRLRRLRAELEGLDALRPSPQGELRRVSDVILAEPGSEAALSAVLGPLVDAWAAPDRASAEQAATASADQTTVLYPEGAAEVEPGSLMEHVSCEPGFVGLARRLLGGVVLERDVTLSGVYRAPGLVRAGSDPRVRLAARRRRLVDEIARLEPPAAEARRREEESRRAEARVRELRAAAAQRPRLEEIRGQVQAARSAEAREAERLGELERRAEDAERTANELRRAVDEHERRLAEHRAEVRRLELERARWRERLGDLRRQASALDADITNLERSRAARGRRAADAERQAAEVEATLTRLLDVVARARTTVLQAEKESPDEEAELAEAARGLVGVEEARVDARLKVTTLEGSLGLFRREAELAAARMDELRSRMPEGLAPEEVPGGKAREREMRQLERRLEQIGPTNALAESECAELEERYRNLLAQLDDIAAARKDLEELIGQLRAEEDSRYGAVFGAVAASFQEYFGELTAGGKATLREVAGADGPHSGVEILVQPPRKRMQSVSLLSTGERSLTALALVLALQEVNPAPFTIFDEADAALDDANVVRFSDALQRLGRTRQFMVITHNHHTMASASALYGVHLDESGSSHLVSVRLEDVRPADAGAGRASAETEPAAARTA
jgi:chromosome segregation protein